MKKILAAGVICVITASAAYAGDLFAVTVDGVTDTVYMRKFSGEYTQPKAAETGNPYRYQGDGITRFFQTSAFDDGAKGRVGFSYSDDNLGGSIQLRMSTDTSASRDVDYSAWLKFGPWADRFGLRLLAGNNGQNGQVQRYSNFDGFLKNNVGNFGVLFPVWRKNGNFVFGNNFDATANFPYGYDAMGADFGFVNFYGTETYDLFMPVGSNTRKKLNFLADVNVEPITLSLATGGLFEEVSVPTSNTFKAGSSEDTTLNYYDFYNKPLTDGGINFGIRAEGAKIADVLTVSAVYKYMYSFQHKEMIDADDTVNNLDQKKTNHAYGLYVNVSNIPNIDGLGISAGYSGLILGWENPLYKRTAPPEKTLDFIFDKYRKVIFPLYHGIDLRFSYTGIEKLTITFNNNVSFAEVRGLSQSEVDDGLYAEGWAYTSWLRNPYKEVEATDRSESYFGLFNAFGVRYAFSQKVNAEASVASQYGMFTLKWEGDSPVSTTHFLGVYLGASYAVFSTRAGVKGTLRGGLDLRLSSFTRQVVETGTVYEAGVFEFGIPLSLRVEF